MTSTSKNQHEPPKYILEVSNGQNLVTFDERPTMDFIRDTYDEGVHTLYNGEGKVLRRFTVVVNRNGNLKITGTASDGLDGLSTLNLQRLVKQYIRIIKIWPAKANDAKALQKELLRREALVEQATFPGVEFQSDPVPSVEEASAALITVAGLSRLKASV